MTLDRHTNRVRQVRHAIMHRPNSREALHGVVICTGGSRYVLELKRPELDSCRSPTASQIADIHLAEHIGSLSNDWRTPAERRFVTHRLRQQQGCGHLTLKLDAAVRRAGATEPSFAPWALTTMPLSRTG